MSEIENTEQNIRSTRGLKIAIFIMTLLLIVGFCVVFLTIGYRLSNKKARKLMLYKKYHRNQHSKAAFHKIFFLKKLKNKIKYFKFMSKPKVT